MLRRAFRLRRQPRATSAWQARSARQISWQDASSPSPFLTRSNSARHDRRGYPALVASEHATTPGWTPTIIIMNQTQKAGRRTIGNSKSHRHHGVRYHRPNPFPMERHDEEQIDFPENVMHGADRRDDHAGCGSVGRLQYRHPEVEMLVVAARDNFTVGDKEDRPGSDLIAHTILAQHGGLHDFVNGRRFQAEDPCCSVADDQDELHPDRRVSEQRKENLDGSEPLARQRRAIGIVEVCISNHFPAKRAAGWQVAFNHLHAELPRSDKLFQPFGTLVLRDHEFQSGPGVIDGADLY